MTLVSTLFVRFLCGSWFLIGKALYFAVHLFNESLNDLNSLDYFVFEDPHSIFDSLLEIWTVVLAAREQSLSNYVFINGLMEPLTSQVARVVTAHAAPILFHKKLSF